MYKQSIEYLISVYNNIEFNCIYTAASMTLTVAILAS